MKDIFAAIVPKLLSTFQKQGHAHTSAIKPYNILNHACNVEDIGPDVLGLLRELREEQVSTAVSKWVFTQDGTPNPMRPQSPTQYFRKLGKRYGITGFHPHKLRHTSTSLAIANGAGIVSQSVNG